MTTKLEDILVLTRHYAPEPTGSAPPMQQLAEWLAAQGYETHVVTSRPSYPEPRITPGYEAGQQDRVIEAGVHVIRFPTMPVRGARLLARTVPEARFMLQLLVARSTGTLRPSKSVISLCPSTLTVISASFFRKQGGRHVVIVHDVQSGLGAALGSRWVRPVLALLRQIERWSFNRADHLVVLSQGMADALKSLGVHTPVTILPPQVDCSQITPRARPNGAPPTLMYSGNLGRKQGLNQILDLAALLLERTPEVRILIRGEGTMRDALKARIQREGLSNVHLLPLVPANQLADSLAEGDIHLVPQLAAGGDFAVPSKAFAIMAAGRTFVTTATPGSSLAALARDSDAFTFCSPEDPEAFAHCVLDLLADNSKRKRLAANGRHYAEMTADTNLVMNRFIQLITPTEEDDCNERRGKRAAAADAEPFLKKHSGRKAIDVPAANKHRAT